MTSNQCFQESDPETERIAWIQVEYGDVMREVIARGDLAEMHQLRQEARDALAFISTSSGRSRVAEAGIPEDHINDIRLALRSLESAIAKLEQTRS